MTTGCIALTVACATAPSRAGDPGARLIGVWEIAHYLQPEWMDTFDVTRSEDASDLYFRLGGRPEMTLEFVADGTCVVDEAIQGQTTRNTSTWLALSDRPDGITIATNAATTDPAARATVHFLDPDTIKIVQSDPDAHPIFWTRARRALGVEPSRQ